VVAMSGEMVLLHDASDKIAILARIMRISGSVCRESLHSIWMVSSVIFFCACQTAHGKNPTEESGVTSSGYSPAPSLSQLDDIAWTELGPNNQLLIRSIQTAEKCPVAVSGTTRIALSTRGQPSPAFPRTVCEASISLASFAQSGASGIALGGRQLPMTPGELRKIVIIGDTGCRIKQKSNGKIQLQKCNDAHAWPFANVARSAAAEHPDLVIHVGDYHYREAPCPAGEASCIGARSGDNWASWQQDFFVPAMPLLTAAPWIFVRGNHEICQRGGYGWFRYLDPAPVTFAADHSVACLDRTPPYSLTLGGLRFNIIDAADDGNIKPSLALIAGSSALPQQWLFLHRPFLTAGADDEAASGPVSLPESLAAPGRVAAVFTGHKHVLAWHTFADARPPELIVGNGGTELESAPVAETLEKHKDPHLPAPDAPLVEFYDFGYAVLLYLAPDTWQLTAHDRDGTVIHQCRLNTKVGAKTEITCG